MLAPAPTEARAVTVVRMWIDKFQREVLIDEDHPLALAQRALGASGTPIAPPVETLAPPGPASPVADYAEALEALGYAQLQEMARRAGLQNINLKKPAMIAALLPHLEGGTLSLTTPAQVLGIAPAPQP